MPKFETVARMPRMQKYVTQEEFAADPRPDKLLLSTGAFKNEQGQTPLFECVRLAAERLHRQGLSRNYLDIAGYPPFIEALNRLLLGEGHPLLEHGHIISVHTPGGTVALRLGADFIKAHWPHSAIWVSDPTWGNHLKVFQTAGLTVKTYPYYQAEQRAFLFDEMMAAIGAMPPGDVIFLQASTHNPTCLDPSPEQWQQLAEVAHQRALLPFFDIAFFGFTAGIEQDLAGLRQFCQPGRELLIAVSLSKSFALYNERVGALAIVGASHEAAQNVYSQVRHLIRANYSNPPLHGAAVVTEILNDPQLYRMWVQDIEIIRRRIETARRRFAGCLQDLGVEQDLSYLTRERGLFTRLDLSAGQIAALKEKHAIHIASTGRFNITAMTDAQMDRVCRAIGDVL